MGKTLRILLGGDFLIALIAAQVHLLSLVGTRTAAAERLADDFAKGLPLVGVLLLTGYLAELYSRDRQFTPRQAGVRIAVSVVLAFALLSGLYALAPAIHIDQHLLALSLACYGVGQFLWHCRFPSLLQAPGIGRRVLVLGTGPLAWQMAELTAADNGGYCFAGFIRLEGEGGTVAAERLVGDLGTLVETARRLRVSKIVVALTERRGVLPVREVLRCRLAGIRVMDAVSFYEQVTGKLMIENINPSWFIFSDGFRLTPAWRVAKRGVDILLALVGLALTGPLLPVVALLIKFDSPGPVLFRQVRTGEGERPFTLYKFRSMRQDAEQRTGAVWAQENDPRVTRLGRFMRKSRIDEIPQLFNVLKGEMSFVGPRPERPEFVARLTQKIPYYSNRHCVKPGVTGWAQIRYPYGASEEDALEKLRYDLYYTKNYSLGLDLAIIASTFRVVLFGRGGR